MLSVDVISEKYGVEQAAVVLICRVFVGTASTEALNAFLREYSIDWWSLYRVIAKNKIRPVAYHVLQSVDVPTDVKQQLKRDRLSLAINCAEHQQELLKLLNVLKQQGIDAVPYKGLAFAHAFYKDHTLREFVDIDLLINPSTAPDLQKLIDIITPFGYLPMYVLSPGMKRVILENTCEFYFDKYVNGQRKFHVEIQWLAHHPVFELHKKLSNQQLFQDPAVLNLGNTDVKVLNTESHFVTMLLHHGLRENWNSLKYMLDLAMILQNGEPDMKVVTVITREYKFNKVLLSGSQLLNELLGVGGNLSPATQTDPTPYIDVLLSGKKKQRTSWQKQVSVLRNTDDITGKAKLTFKLAKYMFQPSVEDIRYYRLPERWHFLYFFVKFIRLSSEKFKSTS
ncbi:MAG: hypothetical protein BGO70_17645 [Bacteroidetes bacterium 43-93]|nr:nucleotidyltransferase family protein [Bacteroidota bacterium]OJX01567.1 MAG: hypothetical protein BGO70_17645 [Bacteroidetes bacterium 43-93]